MYNEEIIMFAEPILPYGAEAFEEYENTTIVCSIDKEVQHFESKRIII